MRNFVLIFFLIVCNAIYAIETFTIEGKVLCNGKGIENVVVTDGETFATTNNKGVFSMVINSESKFVYISTPSGYNSQVENGVVKYYLPLQGSGKNYNFNLHKSNTDAKRYGLVVISDPQIWAEKEFAKLSISMQDIKETVNSYNNDRPFFGICCGDIVSSNHSFYPRYNEIIESSDITFRNVMGNHDMTNFGRSFETSLSNYESMYGPAYYSYNIGDIHYVVLDNNFYVGRDWYYIGYLPEKQLKWLEKDLKYLKEGSTVILMMHIPSTCTEKDRKEFRYENSASTMINHRGLYDILKPYNVHIFSGHTHTPFNTQITQNLYEHVMPGLSGAWWQGPYCTDGAPNGYEVFEVNGSELKWYYKSTDYPKEYQLKVFSGDDYPDFKGYVVANVWNSDASWKVELYVNGKCIREMERFSAYDPRVKEFYSNTEKLDHKWIYPSLSDHFYRAPLSEAAKNIEVRATDRFGNLFIGKLERK